MKSEHITPDTTRQTPSEELLQLESKATPIAEIKDNEVITLQTIQKQVDDYIASVKPSKIKSSIEKFFTKIDDFSLPNKQLYLLAFIRNRARSTGLDQVIGYMLDTSYIINYDTNTDPALIETVTQVLLLPHVKKYNSTSTHDADVELMLNNKFKVYAKKPIIATDSTKIELINDLNHKEPEYKRLLGFYIDSYVVPDSKWDKNMLMPAMFYHYFCRLYGLNILRNELNSNKDLSPAQLKREIKEQIDPYVLSGKISDVFCHTLFFGGNHLNKVIDRLASSMDKEQAKHERSSFLKM